jgi:hypothetical protein
VTITRREYGKGHAYYIDGQKVDGVTTILGDGMRKKALEYWSANATAEYAIDHWDELTALSPSRRLDTLKKCRFEQRDAAANRGTQVHKLAEKLIHGVEVDVPEELAGYVEATVAFLDTWKIEPVLVEAVVASRTAKYCGTLDVVADLPDGRRGIWDYKTSGKGLYAETAMQLAAYRWADVYLDDKGEEQSMPDVGITCGFGVWIRSDGYEVYELDTSERVFKDFRHVQWVAGVSKRMDSWKSEALEVPA